MEPDSLRSRNFYVEKHNLVLVCRFVIKSVIDKASVGDIDEDSPEVINLLATIEHILNHHARATLFNSGYGTFWNFIKDTTSKMADSCVAKVFTMSSFKNNVTRGRCWLRLALMEKKLAEYLKHSISQQDLLKKYYTEGAIISSEEMQLLIADLIGLEAIDFNFCLRNKDCNLEGRILVDYSPYLKFVHCKEGIENDLQEIHESKHTSHSSHSTEISNHKGKIAAIADSDVKERLAVLQRAFRTTSEQKGYLEQMLKKSELEMASKQVETTNMFKEKSLQTSKQESDIRQLEQVILELQNDLAKAKTENKEMQSVITLLYRRVNGTETPERAVNAKADSTSMYSDNLSMDELTLREDNSSLKPLAGSLISEPGSLTASFERSRRHTDTSSLERAISASTKNLPTAADNGGDRVVIEARRVRATSELSQETTSRYIVSSLANS